MGPIWYFETWLDESFLNLLHHNCETSMKMYQEGANVPTKNSCNLYAIKVNSLSFLENWKKVPWFWKRKPLLYSLWLTFIVWNALSVSRKRFCKIFPVGSFFRELQIKFLWKCPLFKTLFVPWKIAGYAPKSRDYFYLVFM